MYTYKAKIVRIVDGDTLDLHIDLGFDVWTKQRVRVMGIDTPESRTRDLREKVFGKLATARVHELAPVDSIQTIETAIDKKGKFGRVLADVWIEEQEAWMTEIIVKEHLAVAYHGQNKADIRAEHEANWKYLEAQTITQGGHDGPSRITK